MLISHDFAGEAPAIETGGAVSARKRVIGKRPWEIGICGTFDVTNYGDLLFPLIAEKELTGRLGAVTVHPFSYGSRTPPFWPYQVTSVAALPEIIHRLDGMLIGGGFLLRFDKEIAPGYISPAPEIHHPTGYWLTPALIALQHNVPLIWNAPGMHCNDIPVWAHPLMEMALMLSRYVSVRDQPSRSALEFLSGAPVAVVPDTAFAITRLLHLDEEPSAEFRQICEASGLQGAYIVIQATLGLERCVRFFKTHHERFRNLRFLALPLSPALGERHDIIDADLPGVVHLERWPDPLVIAELIGRSEAVVGHSYHLAITALATGVPVFTPQDLSTGKYSALRHFEKIFELPANLEPDPEWFLARVGRTAPCGAARATLDPLARHWDRIAAEIQGQPAPTAPALDRFWQSLPALMEEGAQRLQTSAQRLGESAQGLREAEQKLEQAAEREHTTAVALANERRKVQEVRETNERLEEKLAAARMEAAQCHAGLQDAMRQLAAARVETAARDARIAELLASISWRATSPLRFVGRQVRWHGRRP